MTGDQAQPHATQLRNHWWWRPGWRPGREFYTWHLTFDGQDELHRLVTTYQDALADIPCLDLIPIPWLHLTMQGVGFTDEITPADAGAIADTAARLLTELEPVELTFHRPVMRPEAIALAPAPVTPLSLIRLTIQQAIARVWGTEAVPETGNTFEPHLSIAYVNTDGPAGTVRQAIAKVKAQPITVTIAGASLIVLRRDGHSYRWRTLNRAPIGH